MLYLLTKFARTPPYIITYIMFQKKPTLVAKTRLEHVAKTTNEKCLTAWTSAFTIYFLNIQFHFENAKTFWIEAENNFSLVNFTPCEPCPKPFGILKSKLDFQNSNWEFRSFGHDRFQTRHLPKSPLAIFLFH
jgi:hypothetical protein